MPTISLVVLILDVLLLDNQSEKDRCEGIRVEELKIVKAGVNYGQDSVLRNRRLFACMRHDVERVRVRGKHHLGFESRGVRRVL